jgi:hypothetical protein
MGVLEFMLGSLRGCLEGFPDKRRGLNVRYSMADIGMAAFSVFFMQSPSFLAHQRRFEGGFGRSNCETLFGLSKIPSDNHIRDMLDPAAPALLHPVFGAVVDQLEGIKGGLDVFRRAGGLLPIALDGTAQQSHLPVMGGFAPHPRLRKTPTTPAMIPLKSVCYP